MRLHAAWRNPSYCQYSSLRSLIDGQSPCCLPSTCLCAWCVSSDCLPPDCLTPGCLSPGCFCVAPAKPVRMLLSFCLPAGLLCVNYMAIHKLAACHVVTAFHLSVCQLMLSPGHLAVCECADCRLDLGISQLTAYHLQAACHVCGCLLLLATCRRL